ncbi:MAG TPA: site-2 protease family protein [Armatimonadota bacterium]|nr:site-2 protease family protein [Armatimonadota bacterium]
MDLLLRIVFGAPAFALAIMAHESAHAFAASKLGDPTARNLGRVSLDPRRHFDPLGAIIYVATMVFSQGQFGFGWAKPVPINPFNFRDRRRDFMLSSLAGPVANLVQAAAWALLLRLYSRFAVTTAGFDPFAFMILFGIIINVVLAVFNMIPIPPLDGSRLLAWMLPEDLAYRLDRLEPFGFVIVMALLFFGLFGVVFDLVGSPLLELFLRIAAG